jgi:hypothetical protein
MAALIVIAAIIVVSVILFGGFVAMCRSIRRTDKWGKLRPETPYRHHMLAYSSRWTTAPLPLPEGMRPGGSVPS